MSKLRSLFLTSRNPAVTADFYQQVAELDLEAVEAGGQYKYWRIDRHGLQIAIHDAPAFADYADPPFAASNLTHLYFEIEDIQAFLEKLRQLGISPHSIEAEVITVTDPDGRKVLFGTA